MILMILILIYLLIIKEFNNVIFLNKKKIYKFFLFNFYINYLIIIFIKIYLNNQNI